MTIKEAPEALEDDDILEMVNAGLVEITSSTTSSLNSGSRCSRTFDCIPTWPRAPEEKSPVGVRKNSPRLLRAVNTWIRKWSADGVWQHHGTPVFGRHEIHQERGRRGGRRKLRGLVKLFQTYGSKYDVDYLLMAAQGYQESQLNQSLRAPVGAIGVMQVMPATGKDLAVGDITQVEPNIHAGVKCSAS